MKQDSTIVFVCEHGSAKSVIAAAYFNKLAGEINLDVRAIARGTNPDQELSPKTVAGLHADGLMPVESLPRKLSVADAESDPRIISFCELPREYQKKTVIEHWDDVPPVSEDYEKARDAILKRLRQLMTHL
jgi:arsenate reductase (thioredoxin)